MSTNPASFRMPFESQLAGLPPEHAMVFRNVFNCLVDLQSAVPILKAQIDSKAPATTSSSTSSTSSPSSTVTATEAAQIAKSQAIKQIQTLFGNTNTQAGNYTTANSDYASAVVSTASAASTVTLNSQVLPQWFTTVQNSGTAPMTLAPSSGTVNGQSSITLAAGSAVSVYFDGKNWSTTGLAAPDFTNLSGIALPSQIPPLSAISGVAMPSQVPALSALSGGITISQLPAAGLSVVIATAQLTPTGSQGSMTFTSGLLTSQTPAT